MRPLTPQEIALLQQNNCTASSWENVLVHDHFLAERCSYVRFYGHCSIGDNRGFRYNPLGYDEEYHLSHVTLVDTAVGDFALIENIGESIARYDIQDHCVIKNVGSIAMRGSSSFGNGIRVNVLNETGGRDVMIYDHLSAQIAYMMAMYRHDLDFIESLTQMIEAYAQENTSDRGVIASHSCIVHSGTILNVHIGAHCVIDGASLLENGSIHSDEESPVSIGANVICKGFIILSGCEIKDGVQIENCFVGQSCSFGHLFSAHDSLFFANCQGENGEACAIFAGPYTVSMHKSSLLIAGYYSFLNAGSGSNQSNHLYKLGPIHQGVVERGSKTTSDSYVLWPSRIAPFTLIMGRHVDHVDSSHFPFSYLIENANKSYLVPAVNLRSIGTIRDAKKWPLRDKRSEKGRIDCINFNLLSPYTISKMFKGIAELQRLKATLGSEGETLVYQNMRIRYRALDKGIYYYQLAIKKFIGNSVIQRIQEKQPKTLDELLEAIVPDTHIGTEDWADLSGLIAPRSLVRNIKRGIKMKSYASLLDVQNDFATLHKNYYHYEWEWAYHKMLQFYDKTAREIDREFLLRVINEWIEAVGLLDDMVYQDAQKEFEMFTQVGFGVDLDDREKRTLDFEHVRGSFKTNSVVNEVLEHKRIKTKLGHDTQAFISKLR